MTNVNILDLGGMERSTPRMSGDIFVAVIKKLTMDFRNYAIREWIT